MKLSDLDLDLRLPRPPMVLVAVLVIGAFVPVGLASAIWFKRNYFDPHPRIHIFQDMDNQARGNTQSKSAVFNSGQTMQDYAPGTVAWGRNTHQPDPGMLKDDDLAYRGFEINPDTYQTVTVPVGEGDPQPKYLPGYPDTVTVDRDFVEQGRLMYTIHCQTCHGADGRGQGSTKLVMDNLAKYDTSVAAGKKTGTTPLVPANLTDPKYAEDQYVNGHLYNTIAKGMGTMSSGIGAQIEVKDRWAIVAYVRAMQQAQAK